MNGHSGQKSAAPPARSPLRPLSLSSALRLALRFGLKWRLGIVVDGPDGAVRRLRFVFLQAALEAFDPLRDVAHHVGDLVAAAEQDQHHNEQDEPMPNRKSTHNSTPSM